MIQKFTDKINESVEDKIPTAQEFVEKFTGDDEDGYLRWDTVEHMCKEFAKLHVEAALKAASKNSEIIDVSPQKDGGDPGYFGVNEDSILNAYPLTNIR